MGALRADRVAVQPDHVCARNGGAHLLFDALRPYAELLDTRAAARRAYLGRFRLAAPAPVADEGSVRVIRVRDLAGRAFRDIAAIAAEHHRGEPAAIQIEDGLFARCDGALERLAQRLRERAAIARAELEAQVNDGRARQRQIPNALRQRERRQLSPARGLVRHDPRRRASEHDSGTGDATELERRVDRVIPRIALLLVRRLLFLVDDDQAQTFERREEGRARTDDDIGDSIEYSPPLIETLARRERAVKERDAVPEPRDEPRDDLRREDDLRHKDDHALAPRERGGGRT